MALTIEQRKFLERFLQVPVIENLLAQKAKGPAKGAEGPKPPTAQDLLHAKDDKAAKKHDAQLTEEYEKYLKRAEIVNAALRDYRRALKETGISPADQASLDKLDAALAAARKLADQGKFKEAWDELKGLDTEAVKNQETAQKRALEQAKFKPIYLNKAERMAESLKALERNPGAPAPLPLPGAEAQHEDLTKLLAAGAAKALEGNYEAAYKALQGLSGNVKKGAKAVVKFRTTVGGDAFQLQRVRAANALREWNRLAGVTQAAEIAKARGEYQDSLGKLTLDDDENSAKVKTETATMKSLGDRVLNGIKKLSETEGKAIKLHNELDELFAAIVRLGSAKAIEDIQTPLRAGRTKLGMQDYAGALADFTAIENHVRTKKTELEGDYKKWATIAADVEANVLPELEKIKGGESETVAFPDARGQATLLISEFKGTQSGVVISREWVAAAKVAHKVKNELAVLDATGKALKDQAKAKKQPAKAKAPAKKSKGKPAPPIEPKSPLADRKKKLDPALAAEVTKLEKQIGEVKKTGQPTDVLEQRLLMALLRWEQGDKGERDAALKDHLAKLLAQTARLLDPKRLQQQQAGVPVPTIVPSELETEFGLLLEKVNQTITTLAEDHEMLAKPFRNQLDQLKAAAAAKVETKHLENAKQLQADAEKELQAMARDVEREAKAARALAATLGEKVVKLRKKNENTLPTARNKQYAPYFAGLQQKIDDAVALADSSLLAVVHSATEALDKLQAEFEALEKDAGAKPAAGVENFAAVDKKLEDLKAALKAATTLKACLPSKLAVLEHRLEKELPGTCRAQAPSDALKTLAAFEAEFTSRKKDADTAQAERTNLTKKAGELKVELGKLAGAPKLVEALLKRITTAAAPAEGGEAVSLQELLAIDDIIKETTAFPERRAAAEANSRQASFEAELAKKEWEGALAVFEKDTGREATETAKAARKSGKINKSLYFGKLVPALKEARKLAKKGDYAEANRKLTEAYRWANEFIANPMSAKSVTSSSLKELKGVWRNAVASLAKNLGELKAAIQTETKADPSVDATSVIAMLDRLAGSFDPTAFDQVLNQLSEEDPKVPRRSLKEQGLRYLSTYQTMLDSDPLLAQVGQNPFEVVVSLRRLRDAVTALDLNLQRA
jgi:hypothetical protein